MSEARLSVTSRVAEWRPAVDARRELGGGGGTCWWKTPWVSKVVLLVERGASGPWHSRAISGCREDRREATWGVSDSDHAGRGGLTTPTLAFGRDTDHPFGGGDSIAASRSSANCLATQGSAARNGHRALLRAAPR
jgi:hypothetical protein